MPLEGIEVQMTSIKRKNKTYSKQFKEETVALVTEQGYTVIEAAEAVCVRPNQIYNWKQRINDEASGARLTGEDREELLRLRKEVKKLRIRAMEDMHDKGLIKQIGVCNYNTGLDLSPVNRALKG